MDRIFGLDSVSYHDEGLEHIATVYDPTSLLVMESVLKDAEIPYLLKDRGAGGMVKVIAGYSVMGTDVFVRAEHAKIALELLNAPLNQDATEEENDD